MSKLFAISIFLLCGCTPQIVYRPIFLPLPNRPELPVVSRNSLQCLSEETYKTLAERQSKIKDYCESLETVIKANNKEAENGNNR